MSDEENVSVEQETVQAALPAEESNSAEELLKAEALATKSKENDQDRNWKEARRKMQELEEKTREQEKLLNELRNPKSAQAEEDYGIKDDDLAEGRHVKDLKKELKELRSYIKQKEVSTLDERLQIKYPDFAQVVTKENIELLKETEPELAESLGYNPDPFKQGVAAYKLLKRAGIGAAEVAEKAPPREREKAIQNGQKPMSVNAVTKQSAIGNAHLFENGLTKELKDSLYREMREAAKRA